MLTLFSSLGVWIAAIDIRHRKIPNRLLIIGFTIVVVMQFRSILNAAGVELVDWLDSGALLTFCMMPNFFASRQGRLGMGDVKLFMVVSLWWLPNSFALLLQLLLPWILLAIWGTVRRLGDHRTPFAPAIIAAFLLIAFITN